MSISASQVKDLRDRTGAGMMDCKKALAEANGDIEAAVDLLRKKGLATAEKRKGRSTNHGLVRSHVIGKVAGLVEVNSETDFVARNEEFEAFASAVARLAAERQPASVEALRNLELSGGKTVQETLTEELIAKIGENMLVSRCAIVTLDGPGLIEDYIHAGGTVGVLVALGAPSDAVAAKPEFLEVAHDLALHIAFADPVSIERDGVPAAVLEREKRISRERALEQGKPESIVDKIVEGQLGKFYKDVVLMDQGFVKDDKRSVRDWLAAQGKAIGGDLVVRGFARFKLGEAGADEPEEG
ncbi:elongation factor Ts [Candidatus Sumerlaeota bacterium]|nr:elongation factor Ts [Candidatus Sumerlaeota bacterium]